MTRKHLENGDVMESYTHYLDRISFLRAKLLISDTSFVPNHINLVPKISKNGNFSPFFGDSVIFRLNDELKHFVNMISLRLYHSVPGCFAERLTPDTYHMTLHDLSADRDKYKVASDCFDNEIKLISLMKDADIGFDSIKMKTSYLFNMVNTSIVLAVVPEDEKEWEKLEGLYRLIDEVRMCPYPYLMPHITVAYFNVNGFDDENLKYLKKVIFELNNQDRMRFLLSLHDLSYVKFTSMMEYTDVFRLF